MENEALTEFRNLVAQSLHEVFGVELIAFYENTLQETSNGWKVQVLADPYGLRWFEYDSGTSSASLNQPSPQSLQ